MKNPGIALAVGLVSAFQAAAPALAAENDYPYRYGHHMWSDGWGGMFMGGGMMVVFLIIVVAVVVLLVRGMGGSNGSNTGGSALDILNERYARGEIDTEEYNERKKVITGKG